MPELEAINSVPVANQIPRNVSIRKSFYDLLSCPFSRWMLGNSKVQHFPSLVLQNYKYEQNSQRSGRHREKIYRDEFTDMVFQKGPPGLRGRTFDGVKDPRNSSFRNRNSEFEQLAMNARRTPQWIFAGHSSNQLPNLDIRQRSTVLAVTA